MVFPVTRMRRYRKNSKIRDIVRETKLDKEDLIYPIFFKEELQGDEKEPIESMPGEYRYSLNAGIESLSLGFHCLKVKMRWPVRITHLQE